jgi:hypothetical protein
MQEMTKKCKKSAFALFCLFFVSLLIHPLSILATLAASKTEVSFNVYAAEFSSFFIMALILLFFRYSFYSFVLSAVLKSSFKHIFYSEDHVLAFTLSDLPYLPYLIYLEIVLFEGIEANVMGFIFLPGLMFVGIIALPIAVVLYFFFLRSFRKSLSNS